MSVGDRIINPAGPPSGVGPYSIYEITDETAAQGSKQAAMLVKIVDDNGATLNPAAPALPTGAATSANQATEIASLASIALSTGYSTAVTLTRTADTVAYTANDVIGSAVGSTAALTFASMGLSAGRILITSATLEIDAAAIIAGETSYTLHLYDATPPSALGDNAAFDLPSGDRANYLGSINLGTPVDLGSTLWVETNQINKQIKLATASIFAYLVTVGAYTPTSARVYKITLHAVSL